MAADALQSAALVDAELEALLPRGAEEALPRLEQAASTSRAQADAVRLGLRGLWRQVTPAR
jgi:hypothetical protein